VPNLYKYVNPVPRKEARGRVGDVYGQARHEIGRIPEAVGMFSADPALLAVTWASFREPLLATGLVPRRLKEAVAATVSRLNECPYCVDAHTIMLYGSGSGAVAAQLLGGVPAGQLGGEFRDLCQWVEEASNADTVPASAPFPAAWAPEVLGVLVNFHFLNRMINVLLADTFLPGSDRARKIARRVAGRVMARRIAAERTPGLAPGLQADDAAELPADLAWAAPSKPIASAFAAMAEATRSAARRAAAPEVLDAVERTVAGWRGAPPAMSASWVQEPLAGLRGADRAAARLAVLAALAPYQITERDVQAYREGGPGDGELLNLLSWAAFTAARRIGSWAAPGIGGHDAAGSAGSGAPASR
jgi:AhpD family alkylhydroperoxidase